MPDGQNSAVRLLEFMPELPRTATGKIQRFLLRAKDESETLGGVDGN